MTDRSTLVQAIAAAHAAQDGPGLTRAVAALDDFDRQLAAQAAAGRELDLGAEIAGRRLTPAPLHEFHTAATDWLAEAFVPESDYRVAMIAEASAWYGGLEAAVKADPDEFAVQARGRARTVASAHAGQFAAAAQQFLSTVGYLRSTDAASGLPQIDQTIDPNNQPASTPYPTEVFPTFGEEQDPLNGVETNNHGSGASSERAPLLQQVQQQGGGSGYGSGAERQLEHDEGFDTSHSYAEVPLGPPGEISTSPPATDRQVGSAPTPGLGVNQDAGSDRRQASLAEGYSVPDPFGYRWLMTADIMHPFHERCAGAHWPDEECGDRQHTASVAIGYELNLDQARRRARCEEIGAREGLRAVHVAASLAALGSHHNRVANAWNGSGRTDDDTAVLHGFMAVVRPVLAELAQEAARACPNCPPGCTCGGGKAGKKGCNCPSKEAVVKEAHDFTEEQREHASHSLGPDNKLPVNSLQDLKNAHRRGHQVTGPEAGKVDAYLDRLDNEYDYHPGKAASLAPGRGLDFQ